MVLLLADLDIYYFLILLHVVLYISTINYYYIIIIRLNKVKFNELSTTKFGLCLLNLPKVLLLKQNKAM